MSPDLELELEEQRERFWDDHERRMQRLREQYSEDELDAMLLEDV